MPYTIQVGNRLIQVTQDGHWIEIGRVPYQPIQYELKDDGWHIATADLKQPTRPKDRRARRPQ